MAEQLILPPQVLDDNASPVVASGVFEFYDTGTSTPRQVFSDSGTATSLGTTMDTVTGGRPETNPVFVVAGTDVKLVLKDAAGVTLETIDPCPSVPVTTSAAESVSFNPITGNPSTDVQEAIEANTNAISSADTTRYDTSNKIDSGGRSRYDLFRGSGSDTTPVTDRLYRVRVHQTNTTDTPVDLRFTDGVTPGAYYEVKARSGGNNLVSVGPVTTNGTWWITSAEMDVTFDGSFFVIERILPIGTGSYRMVQLDSTGALPAVPGENLNDIPTRLLHVRDEKAQNTTGGASVTGSYVTRDLTTVVTNEITGASLATNQITLPAGTFEVVISAPAYRTNEHQAFLYDTTGAAELLRGSTEYANSGSNVQSRSIIFGRFTLLVSSVLEVRQTFGAVNSDGMGRAADFGTEIYTDAQIRQVS